ncbi:MAG TPA: O-antigen ligase family protein [Allosphingosinicella sp.]|jgi:O-antigen ligase
MKLSAMGITAIAFLLLCLLMGGASAAGAPANALLQIVSVVLIMVLLWRRARNPVPREGRPLLWIIGIYLAYVLFTMVPLPAGLWSGLPFRDVIASGYRLIGMDLPAIPLTLNPSGTVWSSLSLLPPIAMFLLVLELNQDERRALAFALVAFAGVSIVLGAFQLFGGEQSPLRPYYVTNRTQPVGFFANSNHEVTLLLCAIALTGFMAARAAGRRSRSKRSGGAIVAVSLAVFLSVGVAISGSSAGYALFPIAAVGTLLLYRRAVAGNVEKGWLVGLAVLLVAFAGIAFQGPLSTEAFSEEFKEQPSSRKVLTATTAEAVAASFPVGTGLGSFQNVYRQFENPNRVERQYANHAHNDYVEVALELGLPGILLVLAFILWWAQRSWAVWRGDSPGVGLGRAASLMIGIVLIHSLVDYPIRTSAIAAVFALACALLLPARLGRADTVAEEASEEGGSLRHLSAD